MRRINKILVIQVTMWLGVILDGLETVAMVIPGLFASTNGITVADANSFQFGLWLGAPVMLGWTLILIWGVRRPVERSGILVCLLPVLLGYLVVEAVGLQKGIAPLQNVLPTVVIQLIMISLTIISYLVARALRRQTPVGL